MRIIKADSANWSKIVDEALNRSEENTAEIDKNVSMIIEDVRKRGDEALREYTLKFDGAILDEIRVSEDEISEACSIVGEEFLSILKKSRENIWNYHSKQLQGTWIDSSEEGIVLGQLENPIERIGIYVPGGKAAYPSTVLMNAIPAQVAGVKEIAMTVPPGRDGKVNPYILAAASIAGLSEIYKAGGAQAVGALAWGTESVRPVYKIVGPGNIYVARAKKMVFGQVDIDMIAGPSEVCVIADSSADPVFAAADLLSQAEHDEMAACIMVTTSDKLAYDTAIEVKRQTEYLERKEIIKKSTDSNGLIFIVDSLDLAFDISNRIAPEHLELLIENPFEKLMKVKNAGAVFLGAYSPEPLGDYYAGPNHTLPTSGTAKFSSPLGVYDFVKKSSIIYYSKEKLRQASGMISTFAEREGLTAHSNSIKVRF